MKHEAHEIVTAGMRAAPPISITGLTIAGYPLADWLIVLTIIYTVLQIIKVAVDLTSRRRHSHDRSPTVLDGTKEKPADE